MIKKSKHQNPITAGEPAMPLACTDEKSAYEIMEFLRWGDSPSCPRCGSGNIYQMRNDAATSRQTNFRWLCRECKRSKTVCQFTVRSGTVFEDSKVELRHWCYAFWRATTFKQGVTALDIHQHTGLSYKSSLFVLHRVRYSTRSTSPHSADNVTKGHQKIKQRSSTSKAKDRTKERNPYSKITSKGADKSEVLEVSWLILNHLIKKKSSLFTVKELAQVADISERTFYRYFPRKEDVVRPIFTANAKSLVESFAARDHSESIANSLTAAFEQSWWANHPQQARTIRYIMYESSELRAVWLQVIIDIEVILSEALAIRLGIAPDSRRASLAATVVTAAIRNAFADFSDADPTETLTQSFARNIRILGHQVFTAHPL